MRSDYKITSGAELWRGKSHYDGGEIVVIVTGLLTPSTNRKTGGMAQVYILPTETNPTNASKVGVDASVCGDCKHRHHTGGGCYVNLGHAPLAVYKAWQRGLYPVAGRATLKHLARQRVRLGAYGDLGALPYDGLKTVLAHVRRHTGYTHAWQDAEGLRLKLLQDFTVASVDNLAEETRAVAEGWRTFRVQAGTSATDNNNLHDDSIECLNVSKGLTCFECMLCGGNTKRGKRQIHITAHGARHKRLIV